MKTWLLRSERGWLPADEAAERLFRRMEFGECAEFSVVRPRSIRMHRMYFGICRVIGENQDPPRDEDSIDYELRVLAGHYEVIHVKDEEGRPHEVRIPKRLAFEKLAHDDWMELWPSIEQAIMDRFGEQYLTQAGAPRSEPKRTRRTVPKNQRDRLPAVSDEDADELPGDPPSEPGRTRW